MSVMMKSVFFSDCNYRRRMTSSSSFSGRRNNHPFPFLQVTRETAGCSYRSSSSFSGRRNNHPFLQVSGSAAAAGTGFSSNDDLFLVLRYDHIITDSDREFFGDISWDEKSYYLRSNAKSFYFSLVSTEKGGSVREFRSPDHFEFGCSKGSMATSSCEGLVLLHHEECLWNPRTNQFKALPPPSTPLGHRVSFSHVAAFGFDPKSRDYKIIRFVSFVENSYQPSSSSSCDCDSPPPPQKIEMYSLKNDSLKDFYDPTIASLYMRDSDPIPTHPAYFTPGEEYRSESCYANGCSHWTTTLGKLISFDFAEESFSCIPLPNTGFFEFVIPYRRRRIDGVGCEYKLMEVDGSLGVIVYVASRISSLGNEEQDILDLDAEVWVLNDDRSSWTRKHEIHAAGEGGWCTMLGFCGKNLLLFRRDRATEKPPGLRSEKGLPLLAYDVGAKQVKKFDIYEYFDYMEVLPFSDCKLDFNM